MSTISFSQAFDPHAAGLRLDALRPNRNQANANANDPDENRIVIAGEASAPAKPGQTQNADTVNLSPEAQAAANNSSQSNASDAVSQEDTQSTDDATAPKGSDGEPLDDSEQKQVEELQARDREVRQHEQAHKAAAGSYATSGPTYSYQEGPDGKRYAVGGSVGIDVSPEATPQETIAKMQVVRRAALAPAEPSSQDRKVAAQAARTEQQARAEQAQEQQTSTDAAGDDAEASAQDSEAAQSFAAGEAVGKLEAFAPPTTPRFDAVA